MTARLRYRITDGQLGLGYILDRPEVVQRSAFNDVRKAIDAATVIPSLLGQPPTGV